MTLNTPYAPTRSEDPMPFSLTEVRSWHRPLMIMVAAMSALIVVALFGLLPDGREHMQQPIWVKPLKFGVSFFIHGATLAWLLPKLRKAKPTMWNLGTA